MTTINDLTEKQRRDFCDMIDDLVLNRAPEDTELREGFEYLDEQAFYYNISFYDIILQIYEQEELKELIKKWNSDRKP